MSKVDDELTRRLRQAERPVDADGLFEGLERRRSHRERVRRVQAGMLAFAVLAATAGGFVALRSIFDANPRDIGDASNLPANGQIVFVKDGDDSRLHIYAVQSDGSGERQITEGSTNDSNPAVSPDGQTVAFAHTLDQGEGAAIATVPIQGGRIEWQTAAYHDVSNPTWSPDGTHLAFIGHTATSADLYIAGVDGTQVRRIDLLTAAGYEPGEIRALVPSHPSWSPDGNWIAFTAVVESDAPRSSDLAMIHPDGSGFEWLPADAGPDEFAPAWSPGGTQIAFLRASGVLEEIEAIGGPHEIWTIAPDGSGESLIASADEGSLRLDIAWAPDARSLLVSDGTWISQVDPSPTGDPRVNFVRLVRGFSPSWQPLPAGSLPSPTPTPEPTNSPSMEPQGRDIGLGFDVCNIRRLGGIDFLGDGTRGQAWTAAKVKDNGTCPEPSLGETYLVAADVDGDGVADSSSQTVEFCFFCRPFDAVDFDGNGEDELVVIAAEGSTPAFMVYDVRGPGDPPRIEPVLVAGPGHPEAGEQAGEPLTFSTGGDEGFSGWVRCDDFPAAPVLVITWRDHPIEGNTMEVHETRFVLKDDGMFHVVGSNDYTAPVGDAIRGVSDAPACGVDWQIWS